jgi:hypothetical protein
MHGSVRGGAMRASSVRVVVGKSGIPLMIRDTEPFCIRVWRSESGIEFFEQYYLAFDIREGLFVEITQKPVYPPDEITEGACELYQGSVTLDQLDEETMRRLRNSKSLKRIRAKVREIVQQLTENLDALFFDLKAGD